MSAISRLKTANEGRLLVTGEDGPGIVASVSRVLTECGANIVSLDQHSTGLDEGRFFQRAVFQLDQLAKKQPSLEIDLHRVLTQEFGLQWSLIDSSAPKRAALFVSKLDHCLMELLWRHKRGELSMDIAMVVSNHEDLAWVSEQFDVQFEHIPVEKGLKQQAEAAQLDLLKGQVDFVVLARYMQVLSADFLAAVGVPVINIHHSFLPAFVGAAPYRKAKERGVKLIGATAHFVTEHLDEGPIIEQDVVRVSHTDSADDLVRRGAVIERLVLSRAVEAFCQDRIMRDGLTTVVF